MSPSEQPAYRQGRMAKAHGYPVIANPYGYGDPSGSDAERKLRKAYELWNLGWRRKQ